MAHFAKRNAIMKNVVANQQQNTNKDANNTAGLFKTAKSITDSITYLDPTTIFTEQSHPFIILSASRRSGKTFTLRDMLNKSKQKFDDILLISNTSQYNVDYGYIPDDKKITTAGMDSKINDIKDNQQEALKRKKPMMDYLIIFDDILDDPKVGKRGSNIINDLATLGRHLHISVVVLTQKFNALSTITRSNADFACIARCKNETDIEAFTTSYLTGENEGMEHGTASQKKMAKQIYFNIVEEDFHWLIAHNTKQNSRGYASFVYKYVADQNPKKKFNLIKPKNKKFNGFRDIGEKNIAQMFSMGYTEKRIKRIDMKNLF